MFGYVRVGVVVLTSQKPIFSVRQDCYCLWNVRLMLHNQTVYRCFVLRCVLQWCALQATLMKLLSL